MAPSYAASCVLDVYPDLSPKAVEKCLTYTSFVNIDKRIVYFEVPKAASTAIKQLLYDKDMPIRLFTRKNRETRREMFIHARDNVSLPSLNSLPKTMQRELMEAPDVLRFTVVRNPYSRLTSAWADKVLLCEPTVEDLYWTIRGSAPPFGKKMPIAFDEFIHHLESTDPVTWDRHWRPQVMLVFPRAVSFNHVGKVENLKATEQILSQRGLGKISSSNIRALRLSPYTENLANRVKSLYSDDFDTFSYDDNSWETYSEANVSTDHFIDAIIERNLIISHLYNERDALRVQRDKAYRFSVDRVMSKIRSILAGRRC